MRGVKTNVPFLMNVLKNSTFLAGKCDTFFIDSTPSLFDIEVPEDRASKMLSYIGERILEEDRLPKPQVTVALPPYIKGEIPEGGFKSCWMKRAPRPSPRLYWRKKAAHIRYHHARCAPVSSGNARAHL